MIATSNLSDSLKVKCSAILSKSAYDMVLGQAIDCFFEKKEISFDELKFLHNNKTGALIAGSFEMGAVIAGFKNCNEIYKIGLNLGLLFQINDDIIDATMSSKEAGKPTGNDEFKNSFTNLIGIDESRKIRDEISKNILEQIQKTEPKLLNLIQNLINTYLKG